MRDIIFRGKNIEMGKFVEGDLRTYRNGENEILKTDIEWADGIQDARLFPVDRNTIGQFTGVHDKKLVKIFEKDIVKRRYGVTYSTKQYPSFADNTAIEEIMVIEYEHAGYEFLQLPHDPNDPNFNVTFEVIGNIFDNPELLTEAK